MKIIGSHDTHKIKFSHQIIQLKFYRYQFGHQIIQFKFDRQSTLLNLTLSSISTVLQLWEVYQRPKATLESHNNRAKFFLDIYLHLYEYCIFD